MIFSFPHASDSLTSSTWLRHNLKSKVLCLFMQKQKQHKNNLNKKYLPKIFK